MTQYNCLKHGIVDPVSNDPTNWTCPKCEEEGAAQECEHPNAQSNGTSGHWGCPDCGAGNEEEAAKEAVIAAAEAWGKVTMGPSSYDTVTSVGQSLHAALLHLRASRQPKGVKPEEVEAMTQFRFVSGTGDRVYLLLKDLGQRRYFNEYGQLLYFAPSSRIIPIDPEDS